MSDEASRADRVRAAEMIGALCLATDLGMGFPFEASESTLRQRRRLITADTAGTVALALRGLSKADREAVKAQAEAALERFAGEDGYQIPGVVLCAVAS